jgi:hygromycin-B 4-O-kinase
LSTVKTHVAQERVAAFLGETYESPISGLAPLRGGESSQAFEFLANDDNYVIRINGDPASFEMDRYAYRHFSSAEIPIPEIVQTGNFDDTLHYAISRKLYGKLLDALSDEEHAKTLPSLIDTMDAIHQIDIRSQGKYGNWDENGEARHDSWEQYVLSIKDGVPLGTDWPTLFETSNMERALVDWVCGQISELVGYCPEDISLIHGDFGFDNVLADDGRITAVLDWGGSKYGDFLYDAAWLIFGSDRYDADTFRRHYDSLDTPPPHFRERVFCYQLHIGLGAAGFFAASHQQEKYARARDRLTFLLDTGP